MKHHLYLFLLGMSFVASSSAAPITFNTALPVSKDELIIRNQLIVNRASDSGTSQKKSSLVSTLAYGATRNLTLFATLPITHAEFQTPAERFTNNGIGDAQLVARYTAYQQNSAGKTIRFAPFIGTKLPTGDEDRSNSPAIALGSGSLDLFAGFVTTFATTDWTFDSQLAYRNNGSSNGVEFGDAFTFDASLQYRLIPTQLSATTSAFLNGVIELNVIDQRSNSSSGISNTNSGGTTAFIAPGLQYITHRWILESSVQLPIKTNNNDLESDYIARIGIRTNF